MVARHDAETVASCDAEAVAKCLAEMVARYDAETVASCDGEAVPEDIALLLVAKFCRDGKALLDFLLAIVVANAPAAGDRMVRRAAG